MPKPLHANHGDVRPSDELAFFMHHLNAALLPFWLSRSVDQEYGGFLPCFDNEDRRLQSYDKFTWSLGRMVWLWAKLASVTTLTTGDRSSWPGTSFLPTGSVACAKTARSLSPRSAAAPFSTTMARSAISGVS